MKNLIQYSKQCYVVSASPYFDILINSDMHSKKVNKPNQEVLCMQCNALSWGRQFIFGVIRQKFHNILSEFCNSAGLNNT